LRVEITRLSGGIAELSMKAERRHELKHNELADWLVERIDPARPHLTGIALGIGVLVLVVLASTWYFRGEKAATATAWSSYFQAFDDREPQKSLSNVAAAHSGSKAAWWALLSLGDLNLGDGEALLYSDRQQAQELLKKAEEAYKQVEAADDPMLKTRARLGLAKVYESLLKPDEARKYYELIAETEKDSAIGKAAAEDAKRLKDSRQVAFLDWFAQQTPKRPGPLPGLGDDVPPLPGSLPARPDIGLPGGVGLGEIGTGTPAAPPPSFPPPATDATPPAADPDSKAEKPKSDDAPRPEQSPDSKASDTKPAEGAAPEPTADKPATPADGEKKTD
jgi:hypothetical protein